jgi:hypothetical protein
VRVHVRECMQGFGCASWFGSGAGRCGPEEEPIPELGWEDLENDGRSLVRLGKRETKEIEARRVRKPMNVTEGADEDDQVLVCYNWLLLLVAKNEV